MKYQMSLRNIDDSIINTVWIKNYVKFIVMKNNDEVRDYLKIMKKRLTDSPRIDCMNALPKILMDVADIIIYENTVVQLTALINLRNIINTTLPDARPHLSFLVDNLKLMMINKNWNIRKRSIQHMYILLEFLPNDMSNNFFSILPYFLNAVEDENKRYGNVFHILGRCKTLNKIRIFIELYYDKIQALQSVKNEIIANAASIRHLLKFVLQLWKEIKNLIIDIHLHSMVTSHFSEDYVPRTALTKSVAMGLHNVMIVSLLIHDMTSVFLNFLREHTQFYNKHIFPLFPCLALRSNCNVNICTILEVRYTDPDTTVELNNLADKVYEAFDSKDIKTICLKELKLYLNIMCDKYNI